MALEAHLQQVIPLMKVVHAMQAWGERQEASLAVRAACLAEVLVRLETSLAFPESGFGSSIGMFECFVERGSAVAISGAGLDRASNCHKQHTHSQGPCRRVFNLYAVLTKGH